MQQPMHMASYADALCFSDNRAPCGMLAIFFLSQGPYPSTVSTPKEYRIRVIEYRTRVNTNARVRALSDHPLAHTLTFICSLYAWFHHPQGSSHPFSAYRRRKLRRSLLLPYRPLQTARYYYPRVRVGFSITVAVIGWQGAYSESPAALKVCAGRYVYSSIPRNGNRHF